VEHIFMKFGANRILWGSDWPVCRLRAEYDAWHGTASELTAHLSSDNKANVFGKNAIKAYKLLV